MNKLFLLDLDNTLFDSLSFRKTLFSNIGKVLDNGKNVKRMTLLSKSVAVSMIDEIGFFDPDIFANRLANKIGRKVQSERLMEAIYHPSNFKDNLYKDVVKTLNVLSRHGEVGIYSQGVVKLQRAKLRAIEHLFHPDRIYITRNKKSEMGKIFPRLSDYKIYYIDDVLSMLSQARKINQHIFTIWIKQGIHEFSQQEIAHFQPDAVITTISELIPIIK